MTTIPLRQSRLAAAGSRVVSQGGVGFWFSLMLVWLVFEFARPSNPLKIPLVISFTSVAAWILRANKQWRPQTWWFIVFLGVVAASLPFAANSYATYMTGKGLLILFACICLPLQSLITNLSRAKLWIYTFVVTMVYIGGWALFHGGMGPSGASGGQDENYVAALMCMAIPFSYFMLQAEKKRLVQVLLAVSIVVFIGAIALGANPSRGGFIGLCAVALYCVARSPRKQLGFTMLIVGALALFALAGPKFWTEISTSTDYQSGTADIRLEIWKSGLRMWQTSPILGVGAGNFPWVIGDVQTLEQLEKFGRNLGGSIIAHSLPIELLAELGLAGVLAVAVLVGRTWRDLGRVRQATSPRRGTNQASQSSFELHCLSDALRASILALLVNSIFLSLLYYSNLWLLIAVGSAIPFVLRNQAQAQGTWVPPSVPEVPRSGRRPRKISPA